MSARVAGRIVGWVFVMDIKASYSANWSDTRVLACVTTDFAHTLYTDDSRFNIGRRPAAPVLHTPIPF